MKKDKRANLTSLMALLLAIFLMQSWMLAAAQSSSDSDEATSSSSTSSAPSSSAGVNPARTSQSHTEADGRTVDTQSIQMLGPNGTYQSFLDVQRESVKVDASTVRTTEKRYGRGPDGQKVLLQVTEEESHSGSGSEHVVRTVSNPDVNGRLQVVKREIQDTKQTAPNMQEVKTTVLSPNVNGGFVPTMEVQERDTLDKGKVVGYHKSTLVPDGAGKWQTNEVREGTFKQGEGDERLKDEHVLRPDSDGRLAVVERTVTKEAKAGGEKRNIVEKFSSGNPGSASDNALRLDKRVTTVAKPTAEGGKQTVQEVEERSAGNAESSLHVTQQATETVRQGSGGSSQETRTIQTLGPSSGLKTVWMDNKNSKSTPAITVDTKKQPNSK